MVIEPYPWGGVAEYNIGLEDLQDFVDIRYELSDKVLPKLYLDGYSIQFAYIDTTKLFDTVLQDFYFIDKILDVNGVVILDDCGAGCPGVQRVARFIATLPHYNVYACHNKAPQSLPRRVAWRVVRTFVKMIPFKIDFFPTVGFKTDQELGLDSSCIVFQKIDGDKRAWDWDARF